MHSPPAGAARGSGAGGEALGGVQPWLCGACTFENDGGREYCEMCEAPPPAAPPPPSCAAASATVAVGGVRGQKRGGGGVAKKLQMTLGSFGAGKQLPPEYDPKV